jgi:hypothetical protein
VSLAALRDNRLTPERCWNYPGFDLSLGRSRATVPSDRSPIPVSIVVRVRRSSRKAIDIVVIDMTVWHQVSW